MKILALGPVPSPLGPVLKASGCEALETDAPIDAGYVFGSRVEFIVSYRYRHILRKAVIEAVKGNIINLHISFLPWNRGSDPNLWSFLEDTPKGCTIHYINEGVDTGDIIAQREVAFAPSGETLATTYAKLNEEMLDLFRAEWHAIRAGSQRRRSQGPGGSLHRIKDKERFAHLLSEKGWDTEVALLQGKALEMMRKGAGR